MRRPAPSSCRSRWDGAAVATAESFVIVGGGLAAAKAAETLRESGFDGRLILLAGEARLPYERPPLSKGHLLGNEGLEQAIVHPAEWYDEHGVDLRLGTVA